MLLSCNPQFKLFRIPWQSGVLWVARSWKHNCPHHRFTSRHVHLPQQPTTRSPRAQGRFLVCQCWACEPKNSFQNMSPCSAAFNLRICSRYSLEEAGKPTTGPESPSCVRLPDPSQPPPHHRPVQKIVFWTPSKKDRGQDCRHTKKDSFSPNAGKRVAFWKALNQKNSATAAEEWQKYHFLNRVWKMRKSHFGRTPVPW